MFFRRPTINCVTKWYFTTPAVPAPIEWHRYLSACFPDGLPDDARFSLNYRAERPMSFFDKKVGQLGFDGLELLMIHVGDEVVLSIGRRSRPNLPDWFEGVRIEAAAVDFSGQARMIEQLAQVLPVRYAYSRALQDDFIAFSESQIKRRWILHSVTVKPERWLVPCSENGDGEVKGIYPLNYWPSAQLHSMTALGLDISASLQIGPDLYYFDPPIRAEFGRKHPQHAPYIHMDAT